eukprot:SM000031S11508  [mRNA]  locus=s31:53583:55790:- [translate_table: standard]
MGRDVQRRETLVPRPALEYIADLVAPAGPVLLQLGAAHLAFAAGLSSAQHLGLFLNVSCVRPLLGPALGGLAVGASSAAAAQAAATVRQWQTRQQVRGLSKEDLLLHGIVGMVAFKALGGSFRQVLPSSLWHPGAKARASLAAPRGKEPANQAERSTVVDLYRQYGCHHCGKSTGPCHADHMPPNVVVYGRGFHKAANATQLPVVQSPWWRSDALKPMLRQSSHKATNASRQTLAKGTDNVLQRFFPQCTSCSNLQAQALRSGKQGLVIHRSSGWPRPPDLAGAFVAALEPALTDHMWGQHPRSVQ